MENVHFEWKQEYSVHVALIDGQHKGLIKIIDDLYQSIIKKILKKLFLKFLKGLMLMLYTILEQKKNILRSLDIRMQKSILQSMKGIKKILQKWRKTKKRGSLKLCSCFYF